MLSHRQDPTCPTGKERVREGLERVLTKGFLDFYFGTEKYYHIKRACHSGSLEALKRTNFFAHVSKH
jgi:hypothetical protein